MRFVRPDARATGGLLACCFLFAFWSPGEAQFWGGGDEVHWTFTGPGAVTLDWRGPASLVLYGRVAGHYSRYVQATAPDPYPFSSAGPFWEARVSGLAPNTTYHYSIGAGPDHVFHTPPPAGASDFTVMVMGDIGDSRAYSNMPRVQALVAAEQPDFVLAVGDLTYGNAHGQAAVDQHFNDVMVWSQDAAYMPAWGNHEWDSSGDDLRNYKGRFDLPNAQASPGSPAVSCCGEDWYWFDYGNTRFIAYPEPWSGAWADWAARAGSLMDQAEDDPGIEFVVTFGHRPAWSSGHHPGDSKLAAYMAALGATHPKYVLNLNGHSHDYERTYPQGGVVHVTAGIGGSGLEQSGTCLWANGCSPPSYTAFRTMHQGVLKLHFTSDAIEGTAICGPPGGGANDLTCGFGGVMDQFRIENPSNRSLGVGGGGAFRLAARVVPNPLRASGMLQLVVPHAGPARAELFGVDGRRVRVLLDDPALAAGSHQLALDGRDQRGERLRSGVYYYRIQVGGESASGRVLILR